MVEGQKKLPAKLVEAYGKVLEELGRGVQLKDDTYLAHLVDATVDVVRNIDHLHQLQLLTLLEVSLPSPSKIHTRPFLLRLATRLLEKLPDVAPKFNVNLNLPDLLVGLDGGLGDREDDEEDENLCPTLHLVAALIERGEEVEGVWEQLISPLANVYHSLLLYTQRALTDLLSSYLVTNLKLGMSRMKPKGNELVARLESEVESLLTWAKKEAKVDQVVELLSNVVKRVENGGSGKDSDMVKKFLCPLLVTHLPLDPLLCPESWSHPPTPSLVRLLLTCHPSEAVLPYLTLLISSPNTPLNLQKLVLRLAADCPPLLSSMLPVLLPRISEDVFSDADPVLLLSIMSLHKIDHAVEQFAGCPGASDLLIKILERFPDDPTSSHRGNIVTACSVFLRRMITRNLLTAEQSKQLVSPILSSASLRLSASESLRVSLLNLLASILASLPTTINDPLLPTLCTMAMDSSHWPVQDSALSCISSMLSNSSISPLISTNLPLLTSSISTLLTAPMTRYVRASTIKTLTSLVTSPTCLLHPLESLNLLPFFSLEENISLNIDPGTFFEENDEIFRRELIQLITAVYGQLLKKSEKGDLTEVEKKGMELLEALAILMLKKDQDWEVKLLTVNFWRLSFLSSTFSSSPSRAWMTGLKIGCDDYESTVNLQFRKLIKEVGGSPELKTRCKRIIEAPVQNANSLKRDREDYEERPAKNIRADKIGQRKEVPDNEDADKETRTQTIDDILEEPHKLLLKDLVRQECERQAKGLQRKTNEREATIMSCWMEELPIVDPTDFLLWLKQLEKEEEEKCQEESEEGCDKEAVTRLLGVLEDILHSTAGASMNDLIDCY